MHVGVIPREIAIKANAEGIPHACGGDPGKQPSVALTVDVFPMHVGVILRKHGAYMTPEKYSPCMWG